MKFKTIYLIILAIFFLGIVIYDLFNRTNNIQEGLLNTENVKINTALNYLKNRYTKYNSSGSLDETILENINALGSLGDEELDKQVYDILNSTDKPEEQVDKLDVIFGIPLYDPLTDGLVIYYDFKEINYTDPAQPIINNVTPSRYDGIDQVVYNAQITLGKTIQTEIGSVLNSTNPVINGSHLNLLGGYDKPQHDKNGAYLSCNNVPTFYNGNSFLGFSCSLWFNSNTSTGMWCRIFDMGNIGGGQNRICITNNRWGNNGILGFFVSDTTYIWLERIVVNVNKWFHLVWTISTTGVWKIYLNNEILIDQRVSGGIPIKSKRKILFIGKGLKQPYAGSEWYEDGLYNGKIADFRLYQNEISIEVVNMLYNLGDIKANGLPERKGVNIIKNGSFSYPRLEYYEDHKDSTYYEPKDWSATRKAVVANFANNTYSNHLGMYHSISEYSCQYAIITCYIDRLGHLLQTNIPIAPKSRYELSFLHCLWVYCNSKNVYLSVKLGCYVDTEKDKNKSIIPRVSNYDTQNLPGWQRYSIIFTTGTDGSEETLKIALNALNNRADGVTCAQDGHVGTCAIASVSLRKLNSTS